MLCRLRPACVLSAVTLLALGAGACRADPEVAKRQYLKSGDAFVAARQFREAVVQYRNALQQDPRFGEARLKLADTYAQLGEAGRALREYSRAADLLPDNVDAQMKAAGALMSAQQFEEARVHARRALQLEPKNANAQILLGNALAGLKDFDRALKEVEQALKLDPSSAFGYTTLASIQAARGDVSEAEKTFRAAVETHDSRADVHIAFANFLWTQNRMAEAQSELTRAVSLEPRNLLANRALAALYLSTGRTAEAEKPLKVLADIDSMPGAPMKLALADYYVSRNRLDDAARLLGELTKRSDAATSARTRAAVIEYTRAGQAAGHRRIDEVLKAAPKNVPAMLVKARFLMTEQKLDEAIEFARRAVVADRTSVQARFTLATLYRAAGDVDRAIPAYEGVLALNSGVTAAWVELVQLTLAQGLSDQALERAQEAARQLPSDPDIQFVLARSLLAAGQVERAGEITRDLAARYPSSAGVLVTLAETQARMQDEKGAERSLARAFEIDSGNLEAAAALAALDLQRKRPAAARARAAAVLHRSPKSAAAHVFAARVAAAAGDGQGAERYLETALQLDASSIEAYDLLGRLYAGQNKLEEARTRFEALITKQQNSVVAHTMLALIDDIQGRAPEARRRYEHILQIDSGALLACNNLAYIYAEENAQLDVALRLAQRARLRRPDAPQVADTLGWVYYRKGLARQAVPLFEQAAAQQPQNATYQYHLALAYRDSGDARNARAAFEQVVALGPKSPEAAEARAALAAK